MSAERDWQRQYRLSKKLWHYQIIRLDHDDAEALRALAKRKHTTVPELIRTFVAWGLENEYGGADAD
jgi:hypothetical protein